MAELAGRGELDPASSLLLLDAAHRARTAPLDGLPGCGLGRGREKSESALTRAIDATSTDVEPWAGELGLAVRRVQLARRFHNDIVVSTRELRRRRLVTWFRLAGRAPMPGTIELEDGLMNVRRAEAERYRHELRVHCYRMLGSYDDAEDLVQETFLRAWRPRDDFEGRSSFRAWLYRIATNACIDDVRRPQRVFPYQLEPASFPPTAFRRGRTCRGCSRSPTCSSTAPRNPTRRSSGARRSSSPS